MEGKGLEIVDSLLGEAYPAHEVSRCVYIGLLCVQEQATDRPTMVEIVFMLGNETTLPPPNMLGLFSLAHEESPSNKAQNPSH